MKRAVIRAIMAISVAGPSVAVAQTNCRPAEPGRDAKAWLAAAGTAMGTDRGANRLLHYHASQSAEQSYQSDRPYPPYFSAFSSQEIWFDPESGTERVRAEGVFPGTGPGPGSDFLFTARSSWMVRDTLMRAVAPFHAQGMVQRSLNPWAVILDWQRGTEVRVDRVCSYRDYPRVVLSRRTGDRTERLLLDPKTAFPVKLELQESHYLWGDVHVEYLWSTWIHLAGVSFLSASFRVVDGATEVSRTVGRGELIARDNGPVLVPPDPALLMDGKAAFAFLQATPPDTIRIGPSAFLLSNRGYAEAVVLARDTVFMLEATQGEARARQDSVWIGKLFPGHHPIVVVVTDLA
ncbi:MAG: hypothetical protein ABI647_02020 [Gemmatimonadota bacterium]